MYSDVVDFSVLTGKTCLKIEAGMDSVTFDCGDEKFELCHDQDYCEFVTLEDVCGDWNDIVGTPILLAEEVSNFDEPPLDDSDDSYTWTFYKLATNKGYVTMRWFGSSNGYYGEEAILHRIYKK